MKIVTYNLRLGGKAGQRIHWNQIFKEVNPDIFLIQETCDPKLYLSDQDWKNYEHQIQWVKVGSRAWGSAVFVRSGYLKLIPVPDFAGCLVGVEVNGCECSTVTGRSLRIFSLHTPAPYKKPMNQILDFIATLSDDSDLIIGGDFNLTTGKRHPSEGLQDNTLWLLERLRKEFNLMSCWQMANPNEDLPQTLRWRRNKAYPYHCDGVFVPASWYRYLDRCEVLDSPVWETLSDHNPVVATLNFT
jgi:endonuclease/exonuclease/phosphatase family metal-dependent hydrolase